MAEIYYQFAGARSKTADLSAKEKAEELLSSGASPESVRLRTGWFRSEDGLMRYEISDYNASINTALHEELLGQLESDPDLSFDHCSLMGICLP